MILINGQKQQQISVQDRSLQYGDGLFETIAIFKGKPLAWDRHLDRLQHGCERLGIPLPEPSQLKSEAKELSSNCELGVLKLIISRGEGGRCYQAPRQAQTTRILSLHDWPNYPVEYQHKGIEVSIYSMRLGHCPALAGIKHLNRLEQVLLRSEFLNCAHIEGIALDIDENVIEGSMSNIFIVKNGKLLTPELDKAGVAGIIRGRIIEFCERTQSTCEITSLKIEDVMKADEVFFCNSIAGIWPVVRIDQVQFKIGHYTRELQAQLVEENLIVML